MFWPSFLTVYTTLDSLKVIAEIWEHGDNKPEQCDDQKGLRPGLKLLKPKVKGKKEVSGIVD